MPISIGCRSISRSPKGLPDEHNAVEIYAGVFVLDRPVTPRLDGAVDLLVEVRHCGGSRVCHVRTTKPSCGRSLATERAGLSKDCKSLTDKEVTDFRRL
jgi:hypothetical protein